MFSELLPLIHHRPLTITVAALAGGKIRVCVIPQSIKSDEHVNDKAGGHKEVKQIPDEGIKALTTPLSLEGTAAELDAGMPEQLIKFAEAHVSLHDGLERAMTEIAHGVQAIEDRNRAKSAAKTATSKEKGSSKENAQSTQQSKTTPEPETPMNLPLAWCAPSTMSVASTPSQQDAAPSQAIEGGNPEGAS
ncbi:MAG TPA: PRTRC system protein E [Candidatus Angelobacter sp.]|nr:PRTRC system protein E [Candidatus Angelobacter sp.]